MTTTPRLPSAQVTCSTCRGRARSRCAWAQRRIPRRDRYWAADPSLSVFLPDATRDKPLGLCTRAAFKAVAGSMQVPANLRLEAVKRRILRPQRLDATAFSRCPVHFRSTGDVRSARPHRLRRAARGHAKTTPVRSVADAARERVHDPARARRPQDVPRLVATERTAYQTLARLGSHRAMLQTLLAAHHSSR